MSKNDQILRKLMLAQENPDLNIGFDTKDLAALVITVMKAVKTIEQSMNNGQLDIGAKLKKDIEKAIADGSTMQKQIAARMSDVVSDLEEQANSTKTELTTEVKNALATLQAKVDSLTNGEDGIVTDAEIQRAAEIASALIDLPDFDEMVDTAIKSSGESIVDAINLLPDGDGVEMSKVKGLLSLIDQVKTQIARIPTGQGGTIGKGQVYNFIRQAIADGTISTGSSLPDQSGNNGKFLTTDGTDASWATLAGGGDMAAAVYDPAGGAAQVAFASELHDAVTVTDSAEIDLTLTGQNITAALIAGSIDETKLDASVNASLDLADSATQPGDALTTLSGDLPFSQIEQIATNRILGRSTAGTGDVESLADGAVRDIIGLDTTDSPQFAEVNIGHATDTTITRVSAGVIAVEGTQVARHGDNLSEFVNDAGYITTQSDDQTAAEVPFTPAGNIAATDVQAALQELDGEKAAASHTHLLAAGATDVTATAAEVNVLDGITATTAELNYVDGVTSNVQTQLDGKSDISTDINAQTGTTYTLVLGDVSTNVTMTNASANTLTVPPNSSVAFPVGTKVLVTQSGAGATTIAAGAGVTINAPTTVTLAIDEQHESRGLIKVAADTWTLM